MNNQGLDSEPAAPKAPYETPTIISEEVFETLALACGKTQSDGGECDAGGIMS